jgi:hypothetical protein
VSQGAAFAPRGHPGLSPYSEELAQLHFFSMKKQHSSGEVEFVITGKAFITPKEPTMNFFAQADKMTNQKTAPYRPTGWGKTMLEALSECVRAINRFPYEGQEPKSAGA